MAAKTTARTTAKSPPAPRRPDRPRPWRRILISAIALLMIAAGAAVARGLLARQDAVAAPSASPQSMATVETVDGEALPVREYELFLAQDRAEAYAYFQQRFGANDSPAFWTTAHGGQTPAGYLKRAALADATRACVQQALAGRYGVIPGGFTYSRFLAALQEQNASRAAALASHQVIYGPTQYTETDYFLYVSAQISEQLQTALAAKGVIPVTDAGLLRYYETHPSQFAQGDGDDQQIGAEGPVADAGAAPFAQSKPVVREYYLQAAYTALVDRLTRQAAVRVDENVLASIPVN